MKQNPEIWFGFFSGRGWSQWEPAKTTDRIVSSNTKYTELTSVLKEHILRGRKRILGQISPEWKKYLNPVLCNIKVFLSYNSTFAKQRQVEI